MYRPKETIIPVNLAEEAKKRVLVKREIRKLIKSLNFPNIEINHVQDLHELENILYKLQQI